MEQVVPSMLRRLRAADIVRMAGLAAASQGQEYSRAGAVQSAMRRGASLAGVVDLTQAEALTAHRENAHEAGETPSRYTTKSRFPVEVEIYNATDWRCVCPCDSHSSTLCAHAAALLYQWLERPGRFTVAELIDTQSGPQEQSVVQKREPIFDAPNQAAREPVRTLLPARSPLDHHGPTPLGSEIDILMQMGLSELRGIAREYELTTNGMNKQQLAEAVLAALHKPELVRRVVAALEKVPRRLLATLTLVGGAITDDDLRGLFERFNMGPSGQLQDVLVGLQGKGLLLRTSLNSSLQQRIGLSGALLDIGWYVPKDVRTVMRVSVPITTFAVEQEAEGAVQVKLSHPFDLLSQLLLVARALDGYQFEQDEERGEPWREGERNGVSYPAGVAPLSRSPVSTTSDGSMAIPLPGEMPNASLLAFLQALVARPRAFLRFAVSLLRLADILHQDDNGTPFLRALPNSAQVLLGPARGEIVRELFELWLTQPSYETLFALQEDGVRLRCRATSFGHPMLRPGELEAEVSEARQTFVSLLALVAEEQWVNFSSFARFVYRLNPLFLQKRQRLFSSPHWWMEVDEGHPLRPTHLPDWLRAESNYLSHLLRGPLHWLGLCDVALSNDGRLLAFRLTPLAHQLFRGAREDGNLFLQERPAPARPVTILNPEEVLLVCEVETWPLIAILESFAEPAGVQSNRLRYLVTPRALSEALGRGQQPGPLLELLRSLQGEEMDALADSARRLLAQLERWITSYGRVRVYSDVTLLEVADAAVMRELLATTSLEREIVQSIQPTLHIVKKVGADRLIDDLKRRGQTPLLHNEEFLYGSE